MKRCPQCGRDYNDDSLSYCLDDGSELLFGPTATDERPAAILHNIEPEKLTGGPSISPDGKFVAAYAFDENAVNQTRVGILPFRGR